MGIYAHPLYYGDYPEIVKSRIAFRSKLEGYNQSRLPEFTQEEKKMLKGASDYFCINIYDSFVVKNILEPPVVHPPRKDYDMRTQDLGKKDGTKVIYNKLSSF